MKRFILAAGFICISTAAFAASTTIHNHSGIDIDHLSVSSAGKNMFGADLMAGQPAAALDNGKTFTLSGLQDGTYDFKVADDDDGKNCVMPNVIIKAGKVALTKKNGTTCK